MLPGRKTGLNHVRTLIEAARIVAALFAVALLLCPVLARAAAVQAAAADAPVAAADPSAKRPVSPYAIAARRQLEQAAKTKKTPSKNAAGQVPSGLRPAHTKRH